jgi:hypothetical protein
MTAVSFMRVLRSKGDDDTREKSKSQNNNSPVCPQSVDARAYASATSFVSKKKTSLIRALERISLSFCVSLCCAALFAPSFGKSN